MMTATGWTARIVAIALVCAPMARAEVRPQPRPASLVEMDAPALAPLEVPDDVQTAVAQPEQPRDPNRGSVTNLPLPRYVSLKGNEGNARRGPGLTHRIDWVFTRSGMPLRITAEYEHWRRVEDSEGVGGWVNFVLLSGVRTALVTQDMAEFHTLPDAESPVSFQAELGVVGKILSCEPAWCRLSAEGNRGWVQKTALWGVDPGEVIE
jgi:SH3-like domain-containing protein